MSTKDELVTVRKLLKSLESGEMKIRLRGKDVTQREIGMLKAEIKRLDSFLAAMRRKP